MKLYYHKTDGGAEYLFDTYIKCKSGHKEGNVNDKTKYIVRIDGNIEKDAELSIRKVDKIKHDYTCQICGKPAKYNFQKGVIQVYQISNNGKFDLIDEKKWGDDENSFYCEHCSDIIR